MPGRQVIATSSSVETLASVEEHDANRATRTQCSFCFTRITPGDVESQTIPSNVRAHKHERFNLWRCPSCSTLHCLEVVDLPSYYRNYPLPTSYGPSDRLAFENLLSRFVRRGFSPEHRFLDYGCGQGHFLRFLREQGFERGQGYDLYSSIDAFRDRGVLEKARFDYILLQDVLEHVEDPRELIRELDSYVKPGGHILIGTPNADDIKLKRHRRHWNQLHPPYHLHVYTRRTLEALGVEHGWQVMDFYDRPFFDTKHFAVNSRALVSYQRFSDGTFDAVAERVRRRRLFLSPSFMFFARFGYWFSPKADMAVMFRKAGS